MPVFLDHTSGVTSYGARLAVLAEKVHRLRDIRPQEVSAVDRAANKRKFLVMKGDSMTTAKEISSDGKGGLTATSKLALPGTFRDTVLTKTAEALETMVAAAGAVQGATASDDAVAELPEDLIAQLTKAQSLLNEVLASATAKKGEPTEAATADAPEDTSPVGTLEKVNELLAKRRGDPMKRFRKTLGDMLKLLDTFGADLDETNKGDAVDTAASKKTDKERRRKDATKAAPKPTKTEKAAPASTASGDGEVITLIKGLNSKLEKQAAEIARLRSQPGTSNGLIVEKADDAPADEEFSWPVDMNSPYDNVEKARQV